MLNEVAFRHEHAEQGLRRMRIHPIMLRHFADCCGTLVELREHSNLIGDQNGREIIWSKSSFPYRIRGAGRVRPRPMSMGNKMPPTCM